MKRFDWRKPIVLASILWLILWFVYPMSVRGLQWGVTGPQSPLWQWFLAPAMLKEVLLLWVIVCFLIALAWGGAVALRDKMLALHYRVLVAFLLGAVLIETMGIVRPPSFVPGRFSNNPFFDNLRDHHPDTPPLLAPPAYDRYVVAFGTWTSDSSKGSGHPSLTKIDCERDLKVCIEATASIDSWGLLDVETLGWQIKTWDVDKIITDDILVAPCVTRSLTIDRKAKLIASTVVWEQPEPTLPLPEACQATKQEPALFQLSHRGGSSQSLLQSILSKLQMMQRHDNRRSGGIYSLY